MADGSALAPGDVKIDVARLNSNDMQVAGDALAGLFAEEGTSAPEIRQEVAPADDQPADDAADENPPSVDDEIGHSEPGESPAIAPPVSWTAEEKQLFAELPPALQQTLTRRESERERLTLTQNREASDRQKALEAERQQLASVRAQQQNLTAGLLLQLYPELERFQKTDWDVLARDRPAEWAAQRQAWDNLQLRFGTAQRQLETLQQQEHQKQAEERKTFLNEQYQRLVEREPAFNDRAKFRAFGEDLARHLPEFSKEELSGVMDHRLLLVARDAMRYRQSQLARAEAQAKRTNATPQPQQRRLAPAPRRSNSAAEEAQSRQLTGLHETFRKSGNLRDAADLLAATGLFGKA